MMSVCYDVLARVVHHYGMFIYIHVLAHYDEKDACCVWLSDLHTWLKSTPVTFLSSVCLSCPSRAKWIASTVALADRLPMHACRR